MRIFHAFTLLLKIGIKRIFCKITRGDISVTGVYLQKSFFLSAAGNLFRSRFCRIVKAASWKPLSAIPAAFSSKSNNRQRSPETITRNMKGPSSNQPGPLGTNQDHPGTILCIFCLTFYSINPQPPIVQSLP